MFGGISVSLLVACAAPTTTVAAAQERSDFAEIGREYEQIALPLVRVFCLECHAAAAKEGELDLERFATLADVRRDPAAWQKVVVMLDDGEMPPRDAKQPTSAQRRELRDWAQRYLDAEALASAGDPGPVVLRRLNNAEYTYTLRDLTGVESLAPAREFPVDGAAGEGFTNASNALSMSPALVAKYLDAAKDVASHAVLLPSGLRFSPSSTRRDWTNEVLAEIRDFYRQFSEHAGATQVNLQGIVFDTNDGGRLPIEKYLAATLLERDALRRDPAAIEAVAHQHGLNAKYLGILWRTLTDARPSLLLDVVRERWRAAGPDETAQLTAEIQKWQQSLWRFTSVGHIGKLNGPTAWQEPVSPLAARHEIRLPLAPAAGQQAVVLYLAASDAGDGNGQDFAVWERARLVAPGRPDLLLRDLRQTTRRLLDRRTRLFAATAATLRGAAEASRATDPPDVAELARKHGVSSDALEAWLDLLGIGARASVHLDLFREQLKNTSGYEFVQGWGVDETPSMFANSSAQHVRIPGNLKPHGVCVHPSPTVAAAVGWKSPLAATMRVAGQVTHAHPECGNGVTWTLERRRGNTRQILGKGIAQGGQPVPIGPLESLSVQVGDLVSLRIGPRDANHSCDLTDLELNLSSQGGDQRQWSLAADVSPDVLAGNPHADRQGNEAVWHFYREPIEGGDAGVVLPVGSMLSKWQASATADEQEKFASQLQDLFLQGPPAGLDEQHPDVQLHRLLTSLGGPLLGGFDSPAAGSPPTTSDQGNESANQQADAQANLPANAQANSQAEEFGLDPLLFGRLPDGSSIEAADLCVRAPAVIEVRIPADLAAGAELVTTATLAAMANEEGSAQLLVLATKPDLSAGLVTSTATKLKPSGPWTSGQPGVSHDAPVLVRDGSAARQRWEQSLREFRDVFPPALCYTKIVPVDEVVTLTLFYREDDALRRLMLDDAQAARLDRLWSELHFISRDALTLVDAFNQIMEFATQDADPKVFEPMRQPIQARAAAFRQNLVDAEPAQLDAVLAYSQQAYRRPLLEKEDAELRALYARLRQEELPHDEALRLTLARVLVSPSFLYRAESPAAGAAQGPVSDHELATRLSYFLWSSQPDEALRRAAAAGELRDDAKLLEQARRMLGDPRARRLATEFACQWLHIYEFDRLDEKSDRHFPDFVALRGAMYEESILFFTDFFQANRAVREILDADYAILNEPLARHYGVPDVAGEQWRRVDGVRQYSRGGILAQASTLAKQSGASRTSPILRGNWISEVLLGERSPRPPKGVPPLPDDEADTEGLSLRQLVEKHTSDEKCSVCHKRIDPLGFALEEFDAIGRKRERDLGDRPIDASTTTIDGARLTGLEGLRDYLTHHRRAAFTRQFCKKLLGYALGRATQLSDEPLLTEMQAGLRDHDDRVWSAIEAIISSRQFRETRGRERLADAAPAQTD